jgi:hypothetical protein
MLQLQQQSPSSWERKPQDVDPGAAAEAFSHGQLYVAIS